MPSYTMAVLLLFYSVSVKDMREYLFMDCANCNMRQIMCKCNIPVSPTLLYKCMKTQTLQCYKTYGLGNTFMLCLLLTTPGFY